MTEFVQQWLGVTDSTWRREQVLAEHAEGGHSKAS
jgi:hypothetical protein